ncbi:MAG: hypothetical protein ACRDMU_04705 [Gaiellaceae bacterium]
MGEDLHDLLPLIGIGILVEILRRLGFAFVAVRAEERAAEPAEEDAGA